MQLQWRKCLSLRETTRSVTSYVFGPCLMLEYHHAQHKQAKRVFYFEGKHFGHEADMIKYIDALAGKPRAKACNKGMAKA